jgi:hypothetical protein
MTENPIPKNGLDALLTPEESVLILMDHQPFQFAAVRSHEQTMIVNNVVGLAKTAKLFGYRRSSPLSSRPGRTADPGIAGRVSGPAADRADLDQYLAG